MNNMDKVITSLEYCLEGLCDRCDYKNSNDPGGCQDKLMLDALNVIKAQWPRVLSLKEAQALDDESVVWFEHKRIHSIHPRVVCSSCSTGIEFSDGAVWTYELDGYNKTWRCWTARPTDEQMEVTPWKEKKS